MLFKICENSTITIRTLELIQHRICTLCTVQQFCTTFHLHNGHMVTLWHFWHTFSSKFRIHLYCKHCCACYYFRLHWWGVGDRDEHLVLHCDDVYAGADYPNLPPYISKTVLVETPRDAWRTERSSSYEICNAQDRKGQPKNIE